jgi:hypothetical protein
VWKKKLEKMTDEGKALPSFSIESRRQKLEESRSEIESVKKRRDERLKEQEETKVLRDQMQRDLEIEANIEFDQREVEFHRLQSWKRSQIRIQDGRPEASDELLKYLFVRLKLSDPEALRQLGIALGESEREIQARELFLECLDVDLADVGALMGSMEQGQLWQLRADVLEMKDNCGPEPAPSTATHPLSSSSSSSSTSGDKNAQERFFWACALVAVDRYLDIQTAMQALSSNASASSSSSLLRQAEIAVACGSKADYVTGSGVGGAVAEQVLAMLQAKSLAELIDMEKYVDTFFMLFIYFF